MNFACRSKEAVGDIDGDALLALSLKPIEQKREVDVLALRAVLDESFFRVASWSSKISLVS
jgi:hypothetical protein